MVDAGSFEIEHRANSAKVADMHEARERKLSDVIRETKVLVKNSVLRVQFEF